MIRMETSLSGRYTEDIPIKLLKIWGGHVFFIFLKKSLKLTKAVFI